MGGWGATGGLQLNGRATTDVCYQGQEPAKRERASRFLLVGSSAWNPGRQLSGAGREGARTSGAHEVQINYMRASSRLAPACDWAPASAREASPRLRRAKRRPGRRRQAAGGAGGLPPAARSALTNDARAALPPVCSPLAERAPGCWVSGCVSGCAQH